MPIAITGTGLFTPPFSVTNEELVTAFNAYVDEENARNAAAIERGEAKRLERASAEFVTSASGIHRRYFTDREGPLDPKVLAPRIAERPNDERSLQCEMAVAAANEALAQAGTTADRVGAVIIACSNTQRAYPAISVEV